MHLDLELDEEDHIMSKVTLSPVAQNAGTVVDRTPAAPGVANPAGASGSLFDTTRVYPDLGSVDDVRHEIDDAFADMREFHNAEPDQVMRLVAGHSARLNELRVRAMRIEGVHRLWKTLRTTELEPALEALTFQFQVASRLHSVRELDWKIQAGGQPT